MNTNKPESRCFFHGWGAWSHLSQLDLGYFCTWQIDLATIIVSQRNTLTELGIHCIEIEYSGSWERLGDGIGQCLRLHKVTIDNLVKTAAKDTDSNWDDRSLSMDVQKKVAKSITQWVSPEMLELASDHKDEEGSSYWGVLTASVKPEKGLA